MERQRVDGDDIIIAQQYPQTARHLRILVVIAYVLLAIGLVAPIITLEKFVVVENTFSVISGIVQLLKEGQWFLFLVITGFSVVLPLMNSTTS